MHWIQIILLLIQIIREIRGSKVKTKNAMLDAGFTEEQDGTWHMSVTIKKSRRRNATEIPAVIIYDDGQWAIRYSGKLETFESSDAFERHIRLLKCGL